ncbi:hypothetical protein FBEOM_4269 [Fusarium beomiforme]|uniref:Uncharacterized protein n=1 Tax=Fusarium beomiforme TaxID=44412 RepID=A0A9P5AQ39_9HYPO|nr:hypothetical protein FBEOM_4269 [Fusarium beomiforme]
MPKSKSSNSPAPVDERPSKKRSNHVFWANTGKTSKQADDDMFDTLRARIFQPGHTYDSRLSPSKNPFAGGDSCNVLEEHQLRDCSYIGKCSNLRGSVSDSVGQYGGNCCPLPGWSDDDSAMDLRGDNMTTLHDFIGSEPLFNESIGEKIHASTTGNYTDILHNSIPSAPGTPELWKRLLDTAYPEIGDGLDYDSCSTPIVTISGDLQSVMIEAGTTPNSVPEANSKPPAIRDSGTWWHESSPCDPAAEQENLDVVQKLRNDLDIKPTTSKHPGQHIGEAEQIGELWTDKNHINEAMHDLRKLESRLQGWNKHQMVAITST